MNIQNTCNMTEDYCQAVTRLQQHVSKEHTSSSFQLQQRPLPSGVAVAEPLASMTAHAASHVPGVNHLHVPSGSALPPALHTLASMP